MAQVPRINRVTLEIPKDVYDSLMKEYDAVLGDAFYTTKPAGRREFLLTLLVIGMHAWRAREAKRHEASSLVQLATRMPAQEEVTR